MMLTLKLQGLLGLFFSVVCANDEPLLIDHLRWNFLELERTLWNLSSNDIMYQDNIEKSLVTMFYDFDQTLKKMPEDIFPALHPIRIIPEFPALQSALNVIQEKYDVFRTYQNNIMQDVQENTTRWKDLVNDILNNQSGVIDSITYMDDTTFDTEGKIGKDVHEKVLAGDEFWCRGFDQAAIQMFYNIYNVWSLYELKAYILVQFAYLSDILGNIAHSKRMAELSLLSREKYEARVLRLQGYAKIHLIDHTDYIFRCDPGTYVEGKTYEQFTRFIQGHVVNEADLNSGRTCKKTCDYKDYQSTEEYGCYDSSSTFCKSTYRCTGDIYACEPLPPKDLSVCVSNDPTKRFNRIGPWGSGNSCSDVPANKWNRGFVACNYCMCLCDDRYSSLSDRYISLRPVMASRNRVVTGLRFVKRNRMLQLQIQEGELLPYGFIDQSTVNWKPVDDFKIDDAGVREGVDYFRLRRYDRELSLEQLAGYNSNYLMTGVSFDSVGGVGPIFFKIHTSSFDWITGALDYNSGYYIGQAPSRSARVYTPEGYIPIQTPQPSYIRFTSNTIIQISHTHFRDDAAQTAIPFIDIQEVVNTPAVPLTGAGIYYKGRDYAGGFIAPMIKTYHYGNHITSNFFPEIGDRETWVYVG